MEKLFKAKRLDNGEWRVFSISDALSMGFAGFLIDKDTICQYTGINAKNGRIFEGDEFTDCTHAKMYKGSFVVDCGDDLFCLYDEAENLTLTGHNIYDKIKK